MAAEMNRRRRLTGLLACAAIAAGCGNDSGELGLDLAGGVGDPNATDIAFVRAMAVHQREAAELVALARRRAGRMELREIARKIAADRGTEVLRIRRLQRELRGHSPGTARMPRSRADVRQLREAVSFDLRFMEMMIRNLEDALAMAELEQDRGDDARVKRLASQVTEASKRDLERLRRYLRTWYGESPIPGDRDGGGGGGSPDPRL
jgi:uncharacterized protein (DUF305 family)